MSQEVRCPDCGHPNPMELDACTACGFPLPPGVPVAPPSGTTGSEAPPPSEASGLPPMPMRRRRRPRGPRQSVSLWLVFGAIMALVVLYVAIQANVERATRPVAGSNRAQQAFADSIQGVLQRDSTNVPARVRMGDILYDTGNWTEAIVHYRAAVRMDSSLAPAIVDLGVCYYNLGHTEEAERHFRLALARDPHQPVALFNLGIVHERREDFRGAMEYFHRALRSDPPEDVKEAIVQAMGRIQEKAGLRPRPLPEGG